MKLTRLAPILLLEGLKTATAEMFILQNGANSQHVFAILEMCCTLVYDNMRRNDI